MSILSGRMIKQAVKEGSINIKPWSPSHINPEDKVNPASYDLTLGSHVALYENVNHIDFDGSIEGERIYPHHSYSGHNRIDAAKENKVVSHKMSSKGFLLKSGVGYLMHTRERIHTDKYVPVLDGKSSIGRLFVMIHVTAGYGDPGFDGQYTLEVLATYPTIVYPGMRFCQIRFHSIAGDVDNYQNKGTYTGKLAEGPVGSSSWKMFQ